MIRESSRVCSMPIRLTPVRALAAAGALACLGIPLLLLGRSRPAPPLDVSLWYWHRPFALAVDEPEELRSMGVRKLFVRAGVFHLGPDGVRLTLPQEWKSTAAGLDVHLVFNFAPDVVRAFGGIPNQKVLSAVWQSADSEGERAKRAGLSVAGIQLDLDCPTSKLRKYA